MSLQGAIGRVQPPLESRPSIAEHLAALVKDPSPYLLPASSTVPFGCVDGRPFTIDALPVPGRGARPAPPPQAVPRAAGGTLTTWAVDLLLTTLFRPDLPTTGRAGWGPENRDRADPARLGHEMNSWSPAWLSLICSSLRAADLPVSAHTDDHASGHDCGCGAVDSLASVLAILGQRPPGLVALLGEWGTDIADLPDSVPRRAGAMALTMPDGDDIIGVISAYADGPLPVMHGGHHEVAVVANRIAGTTVDTDALGTLLAPACAGTSHEGDAGPVGVEDEGGAGSAQFFVVDTWSFQGIADFLLDRAGRTGAHVEATREQIVATAAAFNAATILTLCGPEMPVAVLNA